MSDYIGDFFTTTEPDATYLHCWRLINAVPRLQEIAAFLTAILHPLEKELSGWSGLTEGQKVTIFEYILNADWSGLQAYLETLFPSEPPSKISSLIETFLYGYYNLAVAQANTLAIEITAEEYLTLASGMKIQYKATRTSVESEIKTLGDTYELLSWEHRVFNDGTFSYEIWGEFYYQNISEDLYTWQYARAVAEGVKAAHYQAEITVAYNEHFGDNETFYTVTWDETLWTPIGTRREVFLPVPTHYYSHYVNPALIMCTDPTTRGGIYSAYDTVDWEYVTDHPDTMGNPWAGDEGERPYDDDLYNWINTTVNPPGFTDLSHEFLLTTHCIYIVYGQGKDPAAEPRPVAPQGGVIPLGIGGALRAPNPLEQLSPFRRKFL